MAYHLGIDVGTTYTAAAIGRDGRVEPATLGTRSVAVPSVVCMAGDRLLVGEPAARRAITDPQRVAREFKRRVGDTTPLLLGGAPVSAELCMARMVEWVVAQVSMVEGERPASLALTHPANWGEYKLDLLCQALRHVDLAPDRLVPEPVAAATAYAAQRPLAPGTVVAVYDLGGGTFDVALVRAGAGEARGGGVAGTGRAGAAEIVGRPDGIERLGGIDFDHAVFRHVLDAVGLDPERLDADDTASASGLAQLREECTEAKEGLSHETEVSIPVMLPQRHTEVRLVRHELEAMIRPALDETVVALRRAVASAGLEAGDVATVLLVGGSSRIPLVAEVVGAGLGRPVAVDARPKDTIPLGAALLAMSAADAASPSGPPPAAAAAPYSGPPTPAPHGAPVPPVPPARSPRGRTALVAGLVAVIVLAGIVGAIALGDRAGSGGGPATPTSSERADPDPGTDPDPASDTTGIDLGALDLGGTTGDAPIPEPLPGDDWSPEARGQFVGDCSTGIADQMAAVGADPVALCGCVYDDVSTSSDFADFNDQWASDDFDPGSRVGQDLTGALLACSTSAG